MFCHTTETVVLIAQLLTFAMWVIVMPLMLWALVGADSRWSFVRWLHENFDYVYFGMLAVVGICVIYIMVAAFVFPKFC